ncbi:MAG TPA: DUF1559 domain-containing protein, partial [Tepidisphaeraceae bacterium]|nr:DUF1559 domain-containing protein [Tepidisphaeraceae bacterium]
MTRRRAFTLVELLIVIGIIVCLIAILLPALAKAREQARQVICASNQRQIVAAAFAYANENRGMLPWTALSGGVNPPRIKNGKVVPAPIIECAAIQMPDWGQYDYTQGALWPYVATDVLSRKRVFNCPSDDQDPRYSGGPYGTVDLTHFRNFSYNFNAWAGGIRLSQIMQPAHKVLVMEQEVPVAITGLPAQSNPNAKRDDPSEPPNVLLLATRHSGQANEGFLDGHVERVDPGLFQGKWLPD